MHILYLFQITIADKHPVKEKGLNFIASLYDFYNIKIGKFVLIFIVHSNSKLNSKQQIVPITKPTEEKEEENSNVIKGKKSILFLGYSF